MELACICSSFLLGGVGGEREQQKKKTTLYLADFLLFFQRIFTHPSGAPYGHVKITIIV